MILKAVKKPVQITCVIWTGKNFDEVSKFTNGDAVMDGDELVIKTLEDGKRSQAKHAATIGDYIIKGVNGEHYFCKPDIFKKTYDLVKSSISEEVISRAKEILD